MFSTTRLQKRELSRSSAVEVAKPPVAAPARMEGRRRPMLEKNEQTQKQVGGGDPALIDGHPFDKSLSAKDFKILVADDSPVYRKLVEHTLAQKQYTLLLAKSGEEALSLFAEHRPSLVITDWMMPDLSGIEFCRRIRNDFEGSYTYIILLTGVTEKDQLVKGLESGADDYLTKPFDANELLARVGVGRRITDLHREIEAKNHALELLALTDSLTGLQNRRAIDIWTTRQFSAAARHKFSFWVAMGDLDNFKTINDTYGHDAGDTVLRRFAEILKAHTRCSDICGRIGGEEFLIALTHAGEEGARLTVERVRRQLERQEFTFRGQTLKVTASFGLAGYRHGQTRDFNQLVGEADEALYAAKSLGRNRIEIYAQ